MNLVSSKLKRYSIHWDLAEHGVVVHSVCSIFTRVTFVFSYDALLQNDPSCRRMEMHQLMAQA